MKGHELATKVRDHLESSFPRLEITIGDNYWDNSMWHARIIGSIAEAGVKNNFRVELGRRYMHFKNVKEIDYFGFLKRYCALYDKYMSWKWTGFSERSWTEIDVTFLDLQKNLTVALCEYENKRDEVKDNIVKFKALHSFDYKRFRPELCLVGFWASSRKYVDTTLKEVIELITHMTRSEKTSYRGKELYKFEPLECHWLLFALFKDAPNFMVKCLSVILNPRANKVEEKEFDVGPTVH